jgi:dTDP-glucose pyrophosphorylase
MAGLGTRFKESGYTTPKPLLNLDGKTMIERVLENVMSKEVQSLILLMSKETEIEIKFLEDKYPWSKVSKVVLEEKTNGPATTVFMAKELLDLNGPLLIANSDQILAHPVANDYNLIEKYDGIIWAMRDNDPKWSFVKIDDQNCGVFVAEKEVISNLATVGIYCFKKTSDFFNAYKKMIENLELVNGEYYVAPTFNHIFTNKSVYVSDLGTVSTVMFGLGTPKDFEYFKALPERFEIYRISSSLQGI